MGKSEGKRQLGRPACCWEDNIKEHLHFYLYTLKHVKGRQMFSAEWHNTFHETNEAVNFSLPPAY